MQLREVRRHSEDNKTMMHEQSPVGESQANGIIENAIQRVQGQFRTIKDNLEARYQAKIKKDSVIVPWMMSHAADTMNRYKVEGDGKTAHERVKGK